MFLYNQGDKQGAAAKLLNFRKNFEIVLGKRRDVDPEVSEKKTLLKSNVEFFGASFINRITFFHLILKAPRNIFKIGSYTKLRRIETSREYIASKDNSR